MVQPVTFATAAAPGTTPGDAATQLEAFWRQIRLNTAVYLEQGHGLPHRQAMEQAGAVVAAVRTSVAVPDREAALARCLQDAAARAAGTALAAKRPSPLPVAGLPMDPQPLAPILIAPSPVVGAARLWATAAAAMVVPALAAFAALVLV